MHFKNYIFVAAVFCLIFLIYFNTNDVSHVNENKLNNNAHSVKSHVSSEKVTNIVKCSDQSLRRYFQTRGKFWVFYNYVPATTSFRCHETVTYTTHADYTFLSNLETLVDRWNGPVSIAVYAPGEDFDIALRSIAYLRNCRSYNIKEFVTFHIFFDIDHFPKKTPVAYSYEDEYNCDDPIPYDADKVETYRHKKGLLYPINVARNIARVTALTHFIFPSDIELYTVLNFPQRFIQMVKEYPQYLNRTKPGVFVIPIFEVTENSQVPDTKTELQEMLKSKSAQIFHAKLCSACHTVPKGKEWTKAKESSGLQVFTIASRTRKYKHWEPFYVGTQREPLFDERMTWEGQSNKITQAFAMCLLDYEYMVLDNVFLIHKPGIKKSKEQIDKYSRVISKTNAMIRSSIKPELIKLYGDRKSCKRVRKFIGPRFHRKRKEPKGTSVNNTRNVWENGGEKKN